MKPSYPTFFSLFLSFLVAPLLVQGQPSMGLHLQMAPKTTLLAEQGYRDAWGGNLEFFSPEYGKTRMGAFSFGLNGAFLGAGGHTEDVILQVPEGAEGTLRVGNRQAHTHVIARYLTPEARVRFYLDGMVGARWFGVSEIATITDLAPGYEDSDERTVLNDWGLSYGGSLGSMIRISDEVSLDMRATYLYRKEAQFANLQTAGNRNGKLAYDFSSAQPNQWFFQIGLNIKLNDGSGCERAPVEDCNCCCGQSSLRSSGNSSILRSGGGFHRAGRSIQAAPSTRIGKH